MESVEDLRLSRNPIGGEIPRWLCNLTSLKVLKLSGSGMKGEIPEQLLRMSSLVELDLSENRLSGEIPSHGRSIPAAAFRGNPGLCGTPLPPCHGARWAGTFSNTTEPIGP